MIPEAAAEAFIRANMTPAPAPGAPEILLYTPGPHTGLRILAENADEPPYWAFAWAGGCAMARHILDHPEIVRGRAVADLGTGGGLAALAAAKAGARRVLALDSDPIALTATRLNAEANGLTVETAPADLDGPLPEADIILAADVFYEEGLAAAVVRYLDRCLAAGMEAFASDPYRRAAPLHRLEPIADYLVRDVGDISPKIRTGVFRFKPG